MNQWNSWVAHEKQPVKRPRVKHMTRSWRVVSGCQVFVWQEGPSCKVPTKVLVWQKIVLLYQIFCPHYKYHHYLKIVRSVLQRENPSKYIWELEIVLCTYNHLHIFLWFSSTPTFPSLDFWEVVSPNTYHIHSECQVRFWCCWEALEGANHW